MRFDGGDNARIYWEPTDTGNQKTWTLSLWVKRVSLETNQSFFTVGDSSNGFEIRFNSDDTIIVQSRVGSSNRYVQNTTEVFRDVSAWYHIVYVLDTTQSTNTNRAKLYVNGEQITLIQFTTNTLYPSQDQNQRVNLSGDDFQFGISRVLSDYSDLYLAEINFIDGTALQPTDFGETNGIWVPKSYSGSYGTNGFYLTFEGTGVSTTSEGTTAQTNIGDDQSGNGHNFSIHSSSLAAHDVVPDAPTNNFPVMNPLDQEQQGSNENEYRDGNLDVKTIGTSPRGKTRATFAFPTSGKWYWEALHENTIGVSLGILAASADLDNSDQLGASADSYAYRNNGQKINNGSQTSYGSSWTNGDVIGVLVDSDAGEIFFYKNGTIQNSGTAAYTGLDMTKHFMPAFSDRTTSNNGRMSFNFGQDGTFEGQKSSGNSDSNGIGDFAYSVPTDALALCSKNLPEPTIGPNSGTNEQADDYFETVLYAGTGSTKSITGIFQPNFVWIKARDGAGSGRQHMLFDSIRGATKVLRSHLANDEVTVSTSLTSFNSDGFTIGGDSDVNTNSENFVAWNWKAGGTAVSNSNGTITSSVSASTDAGFSIATWTGNQSAGATVGHGLSQKPEMFWVKARGASASWAVYHSALGATKWLLLNSTQAATTTSQEWNDTEPTNTVVSLGTSSANSNQSATYVGYFFHSVEGYSKVGSYVGNGSSDGVFVYTGHRVKWLLVKRSNGSGGWHMFDNKRSASNEIDVRIESQDTAQENTSGPPHMDFVSNGFKMRTSFDNMNANGDTYIYLAFGDTFKYSNAR